MSAGDREPEQTRARDGVAWRIGTDAEVGWIRSRTVAGLSITSAIPPVFEDYATVVLPAPDWNDEFRSRAIAEHDRAVLKLLERPAPPQPWWLGYLETGDSDIVFDDAPRVRPYTVDWRYVLVEAYPEQAASWRATSDQVGWKGTELPDVIFPQDRSWLLSTLWDDDWSCIGGSRALIAELLADRLLGPRARRVTIDQDATPPGHVAI
ncbi:MAG TPA: hypothetical protein VLJ80_11265 [Solirubrobacteraceae bacterium]|nr:hypothetical protein [Solirubrobacteraceae bacterium]